MFSRVLGICLALQLTATLLILPVQATPLSEGIAAYDAGDYGKAIMLLQEAVTSNPRSPEAHLWLGVVYGQYATSSEAAGTLKSKAFTELQTAAKLDPKGSYGASARSWLERLGRGHCALILKEVSNSSSVSNQLLESCLGGLFSELKGNKTIQLLDGRRAKPNPAETNLWVAKIAIKYWQVEYPSSETIQKAQLAANNKKTSFGSVLDSLSCQTKTHASAKLELINPKKSNDTLLTTVEATGYAFGYDSKAANASQVAAAKQLAKTLAQRMGHYLEIKNGGSVSNYVHYISLPLDKCYALAGAVSLEDAKKLPVVAVAPFAYGEEVEQGELMGQHAAEVLARNLILSNKYAVIMPDEFQAHTKLGAMAFILPEQASRAAGNLGADKIIVGEVKSTDNWIRKQFMSNSKVTSKVEIVVKTLPCKGNGKGSEKGSYCAESSARLDADTQVDNPQEAPDLIGVTVWEAIAAAAEKAAQALTPK